MTGRVLATFLLAAALFASTGAAPAEASTVAPVFASSLMPKPPAIQAKSTILLDADNGQVLYEKDADEERAPASTTKLMTMLLVLQAVRAKQISWTDEVPVTKDAYQVSVMPDVSSAYLDPKEHFTLRDMMKFIAVLSANDATVAVADKLAGSQAAFVAEMNAEAARLGMTHTHYMNTNGLPEKNHYSSARDLATLARYLVTNYPEVLQFTSIPSVQVRKSTSPWPSTDELLGHYPGLDGLKTGFTDDAGYCYVGTAKQGSVRLISVVMADTTDNIHQRFTDTKLLLDYGFHQFHEQMVAHKGASLSQSVSVPNGKQTDVPVAAKDNLLVDVPNGTSLQLRVVLPQSVKAPVKAGQSVGELECLDGTTVVAKTDVVALAADAKANWFVRMLRAIGDWFHRLLHHG
ncbi:D-alanyl-D-alanine carboxypeptidase [Alicyclobacillus contaminans]|uniref:D-alanyl-D-alanine carboxypeptidase family protein n=1 Tax=Alicyclobacillus contaminans TaxID=392016 RepID=UPI0006881F07|nr:D-alanyl-D-alanine carboxypeptidase family protein [Alicyclobacillus contaminans]GMA50728.1 D-alanyl-D-alanine carboxypeptidase [Alicyclobacillus contaminans]